MNKLKYLLFIAFFVFISLKYGNDARGFFTKNTNSLLGNYVDLKQFVEEKIDEHFFQVSEIEYLREENKQLKQSATLGIAYEQKLNDLLRRESMNEYAPSLELVKSLSYANLNDYYKVWVDYKDFNASRIYGLVHNGNSAGIVVQKDGNPLALLIGDPKSIFSVYVGENNIPGVVYGKKKEVHVRYIPLWMHPEIGDEVITSGMDDMFFKGIKVGVVTAVIEEELSKTAIIRPYVDVEIPAYYYIIKQN
ncbi:MAG: rod shape-determining protein MreC [Campylobacterales bacterium]|nr:rod shape-determining protein MreC [Campylobacterales bacterium]